MKKVLFFSIIVVLLISGCTKSLDDGSELFVAPTIVPSSWIEIHEDGNLLEFHVFNEGIEACEVEIVNPELQDDPSSVLYITPDNNCFQLPDNIGFSISLESWEGFIHEDGDKKEVSVIRK